MNSVKYFEILKKMCDSFDCSSCPMYQNQTGFVGSCTDFQKEHPNEAAKILGGWWASVPRYTNLNHVADGLRKLGFVVDEKKLSGMCPPKEDNHFVHEYHSCTSRKCSECKKWWKEDYKED